jgi:hypothetical protein
MAGLLTGLFYLACGQNAPQHPYGARSDERSSHITRPVLLLFTGFADFACSCCSCFTPKQ